MFVAESLHPKFYPQMENKSTRQVKLHSKYRQSKGGWLREGKEVPWLNVSGLWLEEAGFKIGDQVEITVENNTLIITNQQSHGDQSH